MFKNIKNVRSGLWLIKPLINPLISYKVKIYLLQNSLIARAVHISVETVQNTIQQCTIRENKRQYMASEPAEGNLTAKYTNNANDKIHSSLKVWKRFYTTLM